MLNFLPVLLDKAKKRTLSPCEFSRRWHYIKLGIEERCVGVQQEFEEVRRQASGRVSKGRVDKLLKGVSEKEIEHWKVLVICIENWLERSGGFAYLQQAQHSFEVVEKLWNKRIKALKAVWEREIIS